MEEMYHNCRWCNNQRNGHCPFLPINIDTATELDYAIDEGQLMEVLQESIPSKITGTISAILEDMNIPAKHKKAIMSELQDWNWYDNIDDIESDVSRWIQNTNHSVYPSIDIEQQDFYCNHFR